MQSCLGSDWTFDLLHEKLVESESQKRELISKEKILEGIRQENLDQSKQLTTLRQRNLELEYKMNQTGKRDQDLDQKERELIQMEALIDQKILEYDQKMKQLADRESEIIGLSSQLLGGSSRSKNESKVGQNQEASKTSARLSKHQTFIEDISAQNLSETQFKGRQSFELDQDSRESKYEQRQSFRWAQSDRNLGESRNPQIENSAHQTSSLRGSKVMLRESQGSRAQQYDIEDELQNLGTIDLDTLKQRLRDSTFEQESVQDEDEFQDDEILYEGELAKQQNMFQKTNTGKQNVVRAKIMLESESPSKLTANQSQYSQGDHDYGSSSMKQSQAHSESKKGSEAANFKIQRRAQNQQKTTGKPPSTQSSRIGHQESSEYETIKLNSVVPQKMIIDSESKNFGDQKQPKQSQQPNRAELRYKNQDLPYNQFKVDQLTPEELDSDELEDFQEFKRLRKEKYRKEGGPQSCKSSMLILQENYDELASEKQSKAIAFEIIDKSLDNFKRENFLEKMNKKRQQDSQKAKEQAIDQTEKDQVSTRQNEGSISRYRSNQSQQNSKYGNSRHDSRGPKHTTEVSEGSEKYKVGARKPSQSKLSEKEDSAKAQYKKKGFGTSSNKKIIKNAISFVLFAGENNKLNRLTIEESIENCKFQHFIILFKDEGRHVRLLKLFLIWEDFWAMYVMNEDGEIEKIFGNQKAPEYLRSEMIQKFYKYQSSARKFMPIVGNKEFSIAVDAVVLQHAFKYKQLSQLLSPKKQAYRPVPNRFPLFEDLETVVDLIYLFSKRCPVVVEKIYFDFVQGANPTLESHERILHYSLVPSVESCG